MRRGDELEVLVEELGRDGHGHVLHQGMDVQIPGAAPGDRLRIGIVDVSRHHPRAHAVIEEVLERGAAFVRPACHHAAPLRGSCGGCASQHVTLEAQREAKRGWVNAAFAGLATVEALQGVGEGLNYRNRSNFLLWRSGSGAIRYGSRQPRSSELARMDGCLVLEPPMAEVMERVVAALQDSGLPVAPEAEGLWGVGIRVDRGERCLVELIVLEGELPTSSPPPALRSVAEGLVRERNIAGVVWSTHDGKSNYVRSSAPRALAGSQSLSMSLAGVPLELGAASFFQLNYAVAEALVMDLVRRAKELVPEGAGAVWDLYAGVGVAGIAVARALGAPLRGAESVEEAVASAAHTAAGMDARFERVDLERGTLDALRAWPAPGVILVNPPRRGVSPALLEILAEQRVPVLMTSCNIESLHRDVQGLREAGWQLGELAAWDMLPQTPHVELVATLLPPETARL